MNQFRNLKIILFLQNVLVTLLVAALAMEGFPVIILIVIIVIQMGGMMWIIWNYLRPITEFIRTLQRLLDREFSEEELKEAGKNIWFMREIYKLAERYAAMKTRQKAVQIFNKHTALTALQSQISPHFLYNTLDSIRGQAIIDDNIEIAKMVEALAMFFRYSISRKGNLVTLRDELANINNYMLIQRYRFNNRFSLEIIVDEEDEKAYEFLIPRLIIQPIVENAIYHGLEEKLEGGTVTIEIVVTEETMILTISDDGMGIKPDKLEQINQSLYAGEIDREYGEEKKDRNTGIALPNINRRIQLLFGDEYGVNVYSTLGVGTDVEITVPANYQETREQL